MDWTISLLDGAASTGVKSDKGCKGCFDMETYFDNMTAQDGSTDKLVRDLRVLMQDTEELMRYGCRVLGEQTRIATQQADEAVRRYPSAVAGAAFGFGLLVGLLIARR